MASLSPSLLASCSFDQAACWASSCRRRSDMTFLRRHRTLATITAFVLVYAVIKTLNLTGTLNAYYIQLIMLVGINVVMTLSLGMVNGFTGQFSICLLYTSDAADDLLCVDLGGRRIIK